ncbi:unnamed protein product, partial [Brassica oleracea]
SLTHFHSETKKVRVSFSVLSRELIVSIYPPPCLSVSFFVASTRQTSNRRRPRPAELNLLGGKRKRELGGSVCE